MESVSTYLGYKIIQQLMYYSMHALIFFFFFFTWTHGLYFSGNCVWHQTILCLSGTIRVPYPNFATVILAVIQNKILIPKLFGQIKTQPLYAFCTSQKKHASKFRRHPKHQMGRLSLLHVNVLEDLRLPSQF